MQWAVSAHGHEGKVRADRRTVEYFGRGNHTRDAACFRTTRPVSAFSPQKNAAAIKSKSNALKKKERMIGKSMHSAGGGGGGGAAAAAAAGEGDKKSGGALAGRHERDAAAGDDGDDDDDAAAMSLSKLRMFYYETLVVSTGDDGENGLGLEDETEKDARAELDLLMARANAAAAAISSHHPLSTSSSSSTTTTTTAPHPYLSGDSRHETTRLPWRERARRIVHANLRAADPLIQGSSSSDDDGEADDEDGAERMELDSTATINNNGNGSTAGNGESGRGFGIRQFLSGPSATTSAASTNGASHRSRLLSLTGGNNGQGGSNTSSQSRSRSTSSSSSNNNNSSVSNISSTANGVHFAFTLSSRTLQQIRSRHDRRRMRRHQEKKRFNHRIGIGFVLTSKSNNDTRGGDKNGHDGLSQVSNASSISNNSVSCSTTSTSPLQKLASYQQRNTVSHEDLGKDAFSLAYHGKTGRIMSNGQVFLQCEKFGAGDVVGCGILLDTKTFFFTLNGRLLGMLAATDVHHFDDFVDDGTANRDGVVGRGVDDEDAESDVSFVTDDDDDESDGESGDQFPTSQGDTTLFEDVLYPAISLHDTGECASANFDEFRFDLAGFERQIQKERQQALLLHEIADEREELANDRVINKLIQDYFLHNGYKDAYTIFQKSTSFPSIYGSSILGEDDIDIDIEEEEEEKKTESMDTGFTSSSRSLGSAQLKLLELRHAVRRHICAYETNEALGKVRATLGDAFFLSTTAQQRSGKVLFYCRVLCVLDVLLAQRVPSVNSAKTKTANGGGSLKAEGRRDSSGWNIEEAILCAQEQFSSYLTLSAARAHAAVDDSSNDMEDGKKDKKDTNLFVKSVMDDELELVMSLLLYERQDDIPPESAARKFLSPKFREHVADELNVFLLVNPPPKSKKSGAHQGRRPPSFQPPPPDASASALQNFLVELNSLQSQCLRNGCRVFPGNHTVSSSGSKRNGRNSYRRRHRRASASSSENGGGNGGDEEMRSSSSGSDMSSSSSRSENDDDGDDDDDEEEEE